MLGYSGTGKSYRVSEYATQHEEGKFVVNGYIEGFLTIGYAELCRVPRDSLVVVEDSMDPPETAAKEIFRLLQKYKRHKNLVIFLIAHTAKSSGNFRYLPCVDRISVTKHPNNKRAFFDICSDRKMDKKEVENIWSTFISGVKRFSYLDLECERMEWNTFVLSSDAYEKLREDLNRKVASIFIARGNANLAMRLFDFIIDNFNMKKIRQADLSVAMVTKSGSATRVSILDVLHYATTDEEESVPPEESISLFRALSEMFVIPKLFIRNECFRKRLKTKN